MAPQYLVVSELAIGTERVLHEATTVVEEISKTEMRLRVLGVVQKEVTPMSMHVSHDRFLSQRNIQSCQKWAGHACHLAEHWLY